MATISHLLYVEHALFRSPNGASPVRANGSSLPVYGLAFDDTTSESCFFRILPKGYGSGNLTLVLYWYADTDTNTGHGCVWEAALEALTPGDAQNIETDAFATAQNATGNPSGTSNGLVSTTITITNLDSIAADDYVTVRIARLPANGADDMTGDAILVAASLSYSDT